MLMLLLPAVNVVVHSLMISVEVSSKLYAPHVLPERVENGLPTATANTSVLAADGPNSPFSLRSVMECSLRKMREVIKGNFVPEISGTTSQPPVVRISCGSQTTGLFD